ncbi:hypothetical protein BAE44_0005118 [Dichanthelium oligosanthes]|uniref:Uncharacterized protein n=1 Tax=Dichanthelium oligosanthes TaxID=888268 RepID=A0A1E5W952_9POAL|nr:hypothetical protein BAE44_0005118 [Dichanthelium oligosanthes]
MLSSAGRHPPHHSSCSSRSLASLRMRDTMSSSDMPSLSSIFFSSCLLITSFTLTAPAASTTAAGAFTGSTLVRGSVRDSFTFKLMILLISFLS